MTIKPTKELLEEVFEPYGDTDPKHYVAIGELIDEGVLSMSKDGYTGDYPPEEWVRTHSSKSSTSGSEGEGHVELKIVASQFLQRRGHDMDKSPNPDADDEEPLYRFTGFETQEKTPFSADVSCTQDCCETIVEVGYTPPGRLLDAFGFTTATDPNSAAESDAHFRLSVRHRDYSLEKFYSLPYGSDEVYCFEPQNLPEPEWGHIANIANDVLTSN